MRVITGVRTRVRSLPLNTEEIAGYAAPPGVTSTRIIRVAYNLHNEHPSAWKLRPTSSERSRTKVKRIRPIQFHAALARFAPFACAGSHEFSTAWMGSIKI